MNQNVRILGLGGSLDPNSASLAALNLALEGARLEGAETELWDLQSTSLPMYRHEMEPPPEALRLASAVERAHGMIWSSPLYHGTVSGVFKNTIDWLELLHDRKPPYLTNKIVGLIGTAGGVQSLQAINTMEFVVRALRGWVAPFVIPIARAGQAFDEQGNASDPKLMAQLHQLGREVVRASRRWH